MKHHWLRIGFGLAAAALASTACSGEPAGGAPPADQAQVAAPAPAAAIPEHPGKLLFDANCASCHGPEGLGDGPAAAALPVKPANIRQHFGDHSFEEMVRRVVEGMPPGMPPAPISADEVGQALSYVWSQIAPSEQARLRALLELAMEEH
jgi:mono/diheme cytochrome c family protein